MHAVPGARTSTRAVDAKHIASWYVTDALCDHIIGALLNNSHVAAIRRCEVDAGAITVLWAADVLH